MSSSQHAHFRSGKSLISAQTAIAASEVLLAAGCSSSSDSSGNGGGHPVSGGTLTAVVNADPGNLDPQSSVISTDVQFGFFAYDRLVSFGGDGSLQPNLAASWASDSAGSQYVFTLRKGVTCSDGSPLTPATIAANLNYVANPKNASPLLGAAVPPGAAATADAAANTVTVKLGSPAPFFVNDLTLLPIVCQKGLDDRGSLAHATDGTGPYVLAGASSGNQYTYTLRKDYTWGPAGATAAVAGLPATVVLKVVANETTAANLLLGGGAQIATVSGADRTRLSGAGLFHVGNPQILGELFFNQTAGEPGADPAVRKALTMALNLPQVGAALTDGAGAPAQSLFVTSPQLCSGKTVPGNVPGYDLAQAQALLDQAGWRAGADGVRAENGRKLAITLTFPNDTGDSGPATELMRQQWQKLGVQTTLAGRPNAQLGSILFGTGAWEAGLVPVGVTDPAQGVAFLSGPTPPHGTNFAHIDNPAYASAVAQAQNHPGTAGCPQWDQAEIALLRAVDVVPFEDEVVQLWGKKATFAAVNGVVLPTSIRQLG